MMLIFRSASAFLAGLLLAFGAQAAPVSASGLLGARVANPQGERLGTIRDLAVDVASGSVAYAIVDLQDPKALDSSLGAVPLTALRPGLARDQVIVDLSAEAKWRADLQQQPPDPDARLMRASTLLGMKVDHPTGADFGVIYDLSVDFTTGKVEHAAVDLLAGSFERVRRDVPFGALRFPPGASRALLTLGEGTAR